MTFVLAELSAEGMVIVIAAITTPIITIVGMVLNYLQGKKSDRKVADLTAEQNEKIETVATGVEEVKTNTNGMTDKLVSAARAEGYAQGVIDGQKMTTKQNKDLAVAVVQAASDSNLRLQAADQAKAQQDMTKTDADMGQIHE